jgi:hypothetical protein
VKSVATLQFYLNIKLTQEDQGVLHEVRITEQRGEEVPCPLSCYCNRAVMAIVGCPESVLSTKIHLLGLTHIWSDEYPLGKRVIV